MTNTYTWRQERQMLEDSYARRLLIEHNIKEVTTQRQAKNGTREFEFPVPSYSKQRLEWFKYKNKTNGSLINLKDLPRLRLATFESGMVRKQNGNDRAYQINPQYKQNMRNVWLNNDGEIVIHAYVGNARALIHNPLARMVYLLNYYLKNYKK